MNLRGGEAIAGAFWLGAYSSDMFESVEEPKPKLQGMGKGIMRSYPEFARRDIILAFGETEALWA